MSQYHSDKTVRAGTFFFGTIPLCCVVRLGFTRNDKDVRIGLLRNASVRLDSRGNDEDTRIGILCNTM